METRQEELDKRISEVLSEWKLPKGNDQEVVWEKISNSIRTKKGRVISLKRWHWVAAACVMGVLLSYAVFYSGQVSHTTLNNTYQTVLLPDGSTVHINAGSQLEYNKFTWFLMRNVDLSGEGFFKVTKGSQFKVNTANGSVKVLGTSFNVFSRKDKLDVVCYEGRVKVSDKNSSVTILPGESVHNTEANALEKANLAQKIDEPEWLNGNFTYAGVSLFDVFEEIERQFDVSINTKDVPKDLQFTGEWNTGMDVKSVLGIVCLPFGLNATSTGQDHYQIEARSL